MADVINIYLADVAPGHAKPEATADRADRLLDFFGKDTLDQITGAKCREYVAHRTGKGHGNLGKGGGAKRDLEDLRAAINHHAKEGLHRHNVRVVIPAGGKSRQRWLTRSEVAKLLLICMHTPEMQEDKPTKKRPLRHLCRFIIMGVYTGSRPGAILSAAWDDAEGKSWIDLDNGRFYRLAEGHVETKKRQPPVGIAPRLAAHLKRWHRMDGGEGHVVTFDGYPLLSVKTAMKTATTKANLGEKVPGYALRHTAATWLVSKGVSIWNTAQFIGTSPAMIEKHYGHFSPSYLHEALNAIGANNVKKKG